MNTDGRSRSVSRAVRSASRNGYALVTLRGSFYELDLAPRDLEHLRRRGFVFAVFRQCRQDVRTVRSPPRRAVIIAARFGDHATLPAG
jgi:hypothetical protein